MPEPAVIEKAKLVPIKLANGTADSEVTGDEVEVQFNPESLKVAYTNTIEGQDQAGGAAAQFVTKSSTKLSLDLWFDATAHEEQSDVRRLTEEVNYFVQPQTEGDRKVPPGVRFIWGTFLFEGIVDSLNETLEFFSADGRPLRAQIALSISAQEIQFDFGAAADSQARGTPGTTPQAQARDGESLQDAMGRSGSPKGWQGVALANGIENARILEPGTFIDLNASVDVEVGGGFAAGIDVDVDIGF